MKSLVGYTGFVGSNLAMNGEFDRYYNSKNIEDAFGTQPELLVYAGVPAQKFMANQFPEKDCATIDNAINNIRLIKPKKIVLISTIDVYNTPRDVNEETVIDGAKDEPYGRNRLYFEDFVRENYPGQHLIVRLPGLYGRNLKKNFIYDFIHRVPSMLTEEKYKEVVEKEPSLEKYYESLDNGFFKLKRISLGEELELREVFHNLGFSALDFTDSRGVYQFYNLKYLASHIETALENNIELLNLATEPVGVAEVYERMTGDRWNNELGGEPAEYNYKTLYSEILGGRDGYIFDKEFVLNDIEDFIRRELQIRLSASNIGWSKKEDDAMYEFLKENGYRGIEVAPTRVTEVNPYDDIESVKVFAEKMKVRYGLSISSMQSIWYGKTENIFGGEEERKSLIDYTKRAIDYAAEAGCNNLVFGCPKNRNIREGMSKEECFEKALRFFREVGKYASEKNVVIAIEANPEIYGTNFINTTQEALELAEKIDCDGVKVNLDVGTMIYNDEKADILKGKVKLIHHVHISEPNLVAIKKRELHEQIVEILEKEKYAGYLSVEMSNKNGVDEVKAALKYVGGFGMGCRDGC